MGNLVAEFLIRGSVFLICFAFFLYSTSGLIVGLKWSILSFLPWAKAFKIYNVLQHFQEQAKNPLQLRSNQAPGVYVWQLQLVQVLSDFSESQSTFYFTLSIKHICTNTLCSLAQDLNKSSKPNKKALLQSQKNYKCSEKTDLRVRCTTSFSFTPNVKCI